MKLQTVTSMLKAYEKNKTVKNPRKPIFKGVEGYDVYNPSNTFVYDGMRHIVGRVEKRDEEISTAMFFKETEPNVFEINESLPTYPLQDPFLSRVDGLYIFGGTEVFFEGKEAKWRTVLYKGRDLNSLERFIEAPIGMKDVRFSKFKDGRYVLFTRPQGEKGGRGKIGMLVSDSPETFTTSAIDQAPVFEQVPEKNWLGANELIPLEDGSMGVLGHVASFTNDNLRHYYPVVFKVHSDTLKPTPMKIIATRSDFLNGPSKREDLKDVLFSGGLQLNDNKATLIVGVSDCEVQLIDMDNPFLGR